MAARSSDSRGARVDASRVVKVRPLFGASTRQEPPLSTEGEARGTRCEAEEARGRVGAAPNLQFLQNVTVPDVCAVPSFLKPAAVKLDADFSAPVLDLKHLCEETDGAITGPQS